MAEWVYDRTEEDVENETLKGFINYTDFNRIEGDIKELYDLLAEYGYYFSQTHIVKTNWHYQTYLGEYTTENIPLLEDMYRILDNIQVLLDNFSVYADTPSLPATMEDATIETFNSIEHILHDLHLIITSSVAYFRQCNTFDCGEYDY